MSIDTVASPVIMMMAEKPSIEAGVLGRRIVLCRKRCDYQVVGEIEHIVHLLFDTGDRNLTQVLPPLSLIAFAVLIVSAISSWYFGQMYIFHTQMQYLVQKTKETQCPRPDFVRLYFPSSRGHITRRPPAIHSICSGNSAPFWPSTSVGSLSVETISRARATQVADYLGVSAQQ